MSAYQIRPKKFTRRIIRIGADLIYSGLKRKRTSRGNHEFAAVLARPTEKYAITADGRRHREVLRNGIGRSTNAVQDQHYAVGSSNGNIDNGTCFKTYQFFLVNKIPFRIVRLYGCTLNGISHHHTCVRLEGVRRLWREFRRYNRNH